MDYALEVLDPKKYGVFDVEQLKLIMNLNAYDLVLIENATELFREVMHDNPGNLETLLKSTVESVDTDCVHLDSETFPYYISPKTQEDYQDIADNEQVSQQKYDTAVKRYRRDHLTAKIRSSKCIVSLLAACLIGAGGHYAAYIWNNSNKKLLIFDSMSTFEGPSAYYPYFQQLGRDLFGIPKELAVPCIKNLISLQQTGGFAGHVPYHTAEIIRPKLRAAIRAGDMDKAIRLRKLRDRISLQSTESQNHFCYIWSIWFIHALLAGYSLEDVTAKIADMDIDPLFVIKRYAWTMFKLTSLEDQINHLTFYKKFFPRVWYNQKGPDSDDFRPYELQMPNCNTATDCLEASFSPVSLKEIRPTAPPIEVLELAQLELDELNS